MSPLLRAAILTVLGAPVLLPAQTRTQPPAAPEPHTESAEPAEEQEPLFVLALGGSTGWPFSGGAAAFGSDTSIEFTPIEHRLVIESSATSLFTHTSTEWDIDTVFKKPWSVSPTVEAMAGLGPEYSNIRSHGAYTNTISAEILGDFLFWTSPRHRFGFYAEPAYSIDLRNSHTQAIGLTAGVLFGIPRHRRTR